MDRMIQAGAANGEYGQVNGAGKTANRNNGSRPTRSALLAATAAAVAAFSPLGSRPALATIYTWASATATPLDWTSASSWTANSGFPSAAGDTANLTNNITADIAVTLGTNVTVGTINIGDSNQSNKFTIGANGGNTITLNNSGAGAQISFNNGGNDVFAAPIVIGDSAGLTIANTSSLSRTHSVTGGITGTGNLTFNYSQTSGATGAFTISTGDINNTGSVLLNNTSTAGSGMTISSNIGSNVTSLTKTGGAAVTLSGTNNYTGGTFLNGGILKVSADADLGALPGSPATNLTFGGGTLQTGASFTLGTNRTVALTNGASGTIDTGGGSLTFAGQITGGDGSSSLVKAGANTLLLTGSSNNYSGGTVIQNGTLRVGTGNALPTGTSVTFGTGTTNGTLDLNGKSQQVGGLAVGSGAAAASQVIGSGSTSAGATLIFSGGTSSFAGTIQDKLGSGTQTVALTVSGGALTLSGSNTYTGATTVNNGTLSVNGTLAGSAVTAGNATTAGLTPTLGGGTGASNGGALAPAVGGATSQYYTSSATVGNLAGSVTVNGPGSGSAGHLAPGNSVGTVTVGSLALNGGSVLDYEFNGTANDFTAVTGTLTLNGGGFNLYQEGTTNPLTTPGTYDLLSYGTLGGGDPATTLSVLNPQGGLAYSFNNDSADKVVQLTITATPEPASLGLFGAAAAGLLMRRRRGRRNPATV